MDSNEQHDERELEVIREEMERKRESLADKIGALESQVVGTMQTATDAVSDVKQAVSSVTETISDTASTVKGAVSDTIQTVADTFNVSRHVQNHPWAAVGCAVAAGFAGALLLGGRSREDRVREDAESGDFRGLRSRGEAMRAPEPTPEPPRAAEAGLGSQLLGSLGQTWERLTGGLQGLAIGAMMGLAREMAAKSLPQSVVADVSRFIDDVSDKLGGKTTELSRSVVDYVQEAIASPREEEPPAPAAAPPSQPAKATAAARQQHRNGSRHRAGSH